MRNKSIILIAMFASSAITACAAHNVYEGAQQAARNECNKLFEPDRSACLERNGDDYDTYKKKRAGKY